MIGHMSASRRASPYLLLTMSPLVWAGNFIIGRGVRADIGPPAMPFLRWLFAIATLAPFACVRSCATGLGACSARWKRSAALGAIGVGRRALAYSGSTTLLRPWRNPELIHSDHGHPDVMGAPRRARGIADDRRIHLTVRRAVDAVMELAEPGRIFIGGALSSLLACLLWKRGVAEVGANVAGLFIHLMPVFGHKPRPELSGCADRLVSPCRHCAHTGGNLADQPVRTAARDCGGRGCGDRLSGDDGEVDGEIGDAGHVALQQRLVEVKVEHRDLDAAILRLEEAPAHDELQLRRLKRRKLLLKDQMVRLERQIDPDVLA